MRRLLIQFQLSCIPVISHTFAYYSVVDTSRRVFSLSTTVTLPPDVPLSGLLQLTINRSYEHLQ